MSRSSPEDAFQPAEFAGTAPLPRLEAEALDAVVRATLASADADQKVTPEEIDALKEVARRLGDIPLALEPVAVALVEAIVEANYGQLSREPHVWRVASQRIARLLYDSPTARARLDALWRQLVESTS